MGQGRAPDPHAEGEDEDGVQHRIEDRADQHSLHAHHREALGGDIGVHAQGHLDEDGAQGINAHIVQGVADGVVAGAEDAEHGFRKHQKDHSQHHGHRHQHGEAVAHDPLRLFQVSPPFGDGGPGCAAEGHQGREGGDHHDDGQAHPHAGEGQLAHSLHRLHVADVHPVHQIVQHVDDLGGDGRNGQGKQQLSHAPAAQVHISTAHVLPPSFNRTSALVRTFSSSS